MFSQGGSTAGSHQTVDVTGVRETSFFEVTTQTNKYQVRNVTADYLPYLDEEPLLGDVNGDGQVNISDVTLFVNSMMTETLENLVIENADINRDGFINISDVTALINMILSSR